ncbi:hypothetical protein RAS1_30060 [Phycisphaerae bacterium RAS1]|nr:hypothetical protein RAS1_30060 [Phycisphaerae bacterium RAS1]
MAFEDARQQAGIDDAGIAATVRRAANAAREAGSHADVSHEQRPAKRGR